jgi:hypothetical protein
MDFLDRLQENMVKGLDASRDLFEKAREKAQDLSEIGVLRFEIRQLENQAEKLFGQLGSKTYEFLHERKEKSLTLSNAEIQPFITEIERVKKKIEEKEEDLKKVQAG